MLVDSTKVPELDGALLQQPEMSKDGKLSRHHAARVQARDRYLERDEEDLDPDRRRAARSTGRRGRAKSTGSTRPATAAAGCCTLPVKDGKPAKGDDDLDAACAFIDIPGRRSHEYFPQLSADGNWLVWAATQRGHDHDIADYEIYLWEVGTPPETGGPSDARTPATIAGPTSSSRAGLRSAPRRMPRRRATPPHRPGDAAPCPPAHARIAVLGAGGFLGSHLVPALARRQARRSTPSIVTLRQARARPARRCAGSQARHRRSPGCSTS